MRQTMIALIVILGIAATASAQSRRVVVSDGAFRTEMRAAAAPYSTDWPLATVPARALPSGVDPTVPEFRIRAWMEGASVRVLVSAVIASVPRREVREEQIASVLLSLDQFVEIAATEKYRARRLTLTAYGDSLMRRPYVIETIKIAASSRR